MVLPNTLGDLCFLQSLTEEPRAVSLLRADSLSFSYGAQTVLDGVQLAVGPGDRVALVGPNGVGKSILLRLLAQEEKAETGTVAAVGTVGLRPQERDRRADESIYAYLARRTGVAAADQTMEAAAEAGPAGGAPARAARRRRHRLARPGTAPAHGH
jgi:ATPase subunit of ABC transporter with duplicated ATPase domains